MRNLLAIVVAAALCTGMSPVSGNENKTGENETREKGGMNASMSNETENATGGMRAGWSDSNTSSNTSGMNASTNEESNETSSSSGQTMELTVQSVSQSSQTVTGTESSGKTVHFSTQGVKIVNESGSSKQLSDVQEGQKIEITYTGSETSPTVSKLEIEE